MTCEKGFIKSKNVCTNIIFLNFSQGVSIIYLLPDVHITIKFHLAKYYLLLASMLYPFVYLDIVIGKHFFAAQINFSSFSVTLTYSVHRY